MKLPIQTIQSLQNETSAVGIMNGNFLAIQTLIETLLSRDGLAPNQMTDVLDANNHSIINVPAPVVSTDVARLQDVMDVSAIASAAYDDAVAKLLTAKAKYDLAVVLLNAATTDVETALETIEGIQTNIEGIQTNVGNIEDNVEAIQVDLEASIANLVPEAPNDGEQYVRQNKDWAVVNIPDAGIPEAPNDGQQYVRQSEAWATIEIPDVPVTSVNGKEGAVVLTTDDISEGTPKYTTAADIAKLAGIEAGAQVNVPLKILTAIDTSTVTLPQNIYTNQTFSTTTLS